MSQETQQTYKYLSYWNPSEKITLIPPTQVVTCFLQQNNKVLVLQRGRKDQQHNLWGIPGGKLEKAEPPLKGLIREIFEEISIKFSPDIFKLLGTALSQTPSDGQYGLYLYHAFVPNDLDVRINYSEHHAFQWVTIEEFQQLDLLTAQREAFLLVKDKLSAFF